MAAKGGAVEPREVVAAAMARGGTPVLPRRPAGSVVAEADTTTMACLLKPAALARGRPGGGEADSCATGAKPG